MFCNYCGHELPEKANICPNCHAFIKTENDSDLKLNKIPHNDVTTDDLHLFVGITDIEYYMNKWQRYIDNENSLTPTWNWPAFFFGFLWLAYRKMYFLAFLALPLNLISILVNSSAFTSIINWSLCFLLALYGNKLYFHYSQNQIKKIKGKYFNGDELKKQIINRGGISVKSVFAFFLTCLLFTSIVLNLL